MKLIDIILMENLKKTIDTITNNLKKDMPELYGICTCGYEGNFKYKGMQLDKNNNFAFALYDCPKCESTITSNTIITNLYKQKSEE